MIDIERITRIAGNALIMAGITFLSILAVSAGTFDIVMVKAALVAGGLTFLTLCKGIFSKPKPSEKDKVSSSVKTTYSLGANGQKIDKTTNVSGLQLWL